MTEFFPTEIVPDYRGTTIDYGAQHFISFTWTEADGLHYGSAVVKCSALDSPTAIARATAELAQAFNVKNPVILFFRRLGDA